MYGNEAEVGEAVRRSGLPREEVFVSTWILPSASCKPKNVELICSVGVQASKIMAEEHGYESATRAVDDSLKNFKFGECWCQTRDMITLRHILMDLW